MKLNELSDNSGARKGFKRIGRGIGSGKGKTGGRGVKGQTSRQGVAIDGFEGGQTPLHMRMPKRGFSNADFKIHYTTISLGRLQTALDKGLIKADTTIDAAALRTAKVISNARHGIKLLANGELKSKVSLNIASASEKAKAAVESLGGSVQLPDNSAALAAKAKKTADRKTKAR